MIIEILLGLGAALIGGSGAVRVSNAKERLRNAFNAYGQLLSKAQSAKEALKADLERLGKSVARSCRILEQSHRILAPLQNAATVTVGSSVTVEPSTVELLRQSATLIEDYRYVAASTAGLGVGAAAAVGSWGAISLLGTASTGTAIATLHGAAAANATLAWLGGGSLATGGGGMLAGKLALGGMVALPALALVGVVAHARANEINDKAEEIEEANTKNSKAIEYMNARVVEIQPLHAQLVRETETLNAAVFSANKNLFRFGIFSRAHKYLRHSITGSYYSRTDMAHVEELERAVERFLHFFQQNGTFTKSNSSSQLALPPHFDDIRLVPTESSSLSRRFAISIAAVFVIVALLFYIWHPSHQNASKVVNPPNYKAQSTQSDRVLSTVVRSGEDMPSSVVPGDSESPLIRSQVDDLLSKWLASLRNKDLEANLNCYSRDMSRYYRKKNPSQRWLRSEKSRTFGKIASVRKLRADEVEFEQLSEGVFNIEFKKEWDIVLSNGRIFSGTTKARLILVTEFNRLKINSEEDINDARKN